LKLLLGENFKWFAEIHQKNSKHEHEIEVSRHTVFVELSYTKRKNPMRATKLTRSEVDMILVSVSALASFLRQHMEASPIWVSIFTQLRCHLPAP
jgi:hypothetical protein